MAHGLPGEPGADTPPNLKGGVDLENPILKSMRHSLGQATLHKAVGVVSIILLPNGNLELTGSAAGGATTLAGITARGLAILTAPAQGRAAGETPGSSDTDE